LVVARESYSVASWVVYSAAGSAEQMELGKAVLLVAKKAESKVGL